MNSANLPIECIKHAIQGGGLVLELGAGIDVCSHPNLCKTDAFVYSSDLDYVVDAHAMPFEDNVFDFVFSLAVFEHLHTPWKAAQEIYRVLKPGGKMFVLTAFMQHMHGYPHHYFNMTTMGAERIFSDFDIISCEPSPNCSMEQIAVILMDLHQMSSNLSENESAVALCKSIEEFCRVLPNVQADLIKPIANIESWRRIAPGVEILAMKPF
jgi:SAM-dependent methyltransferase